MLTRINSLANGLNFLSLVVLLGLLTGCGKMWNNLVYQRMEPTTNLAPSSPIPTPTPYVCTNTWTNIDDFDNSAVGASASAVAVDSLGNIFVTGLGGINSWFVRKSADGGATWTLSDSYTDPDPNSNGTQANAIMVDRIHSPESIYVVGSAYLISAGHWIVRKSIDHGATWNTVDNFGPWGFANSVAMDPSGNIYVGGNQNGNEIWTVRKSSDQGATWNTVDTYVNPSAGSSSPASANGIIADSSGAIYVSGSTGDNNFHSYWDVRKSTDQGATWTLIDDYMSTSFFNASQAEGLGIDNLGNIFVSGVAYENTGGDWMVRKSSDSGSTWTISDDYTAGSIANIATAILGDSHGNVFAAGYTSSNASSFINVRESTDHGTTWNMLDSYNYPGSSRMLGTGLTLDLNGTPIEVGNAQEPNSGPTHWIVRTIKCL